MEDIKGYKLELPLLVNHNVELMQRLTQMQGEVALLKDIEDSGKKERKELENEYELQKKEIENMGLEKKDLEKRLQNLKIKHEEEVENWQRIYEKAKEESRQDIDGLSKGYELKIRELQNEIKGVREDSREKDYQIRELNKGMEIGNARQE